MKNNGKKKKHIENVKKSSQSALLGSGQETKICVRVALGHICRVLSMAGLRSSHLSLSLVHIMC